MAAEKEAADRVVGALRVLQVGQFLVMLYAWALIVLSLLGALRWKAARGKTGWWLIFASGVLKVLALWHTRVIVHRAVIAGPAPVVAEHCLSLLLLVIGLALLAFPKAEAPAAAPSAPGAGRRSA
jgi:hypothetical protein